ncbi:aryl hydrocarbon receptor-like [Notothenia coriiceps]|uniref:Aryl hydrocarbon receptor-like n=1 Tax=Notothenia coriiceps TaxID=8208 RepID=A0A6I9P828_9TELE|nr:PREDICTED: aryl hydrocarbon receptor-like [Notothenia coriiceps]
MRCSTLFTCELVALCGSNPGLSTEEDVLTGYLINLTVFYFVQALNGFVIVVTSDGSVFYVSSTIKDYLGFHESDVVHQSVFELIHTDDRSLFRQQLHFALNPATAAAGGDVMKTSGSTVMYNPDQLPPENSSFLERSFVCRFRCLLDNSSGFLVSTTNAKSKLNCPKNVM